MLNRQSRTIFAALLLLSLLLHALLWWWVDIRDFLTSTVEHQSTTVQVTLRQSPKPPQKQPPKKQPPPPVKQQEMQPKKEPPVPEQHLPMHNADKFASSNNRDKSVTKITPGTPPASKKAKRTAPDQPQKLKNDTPTVTHSKPKEQTDKSRSKKNSNPGEQINKDKLISTSGNSEKASPRKNIPVAAVVEDTSAASQGSLATEVSLTDQKPEAVKISEKTLNRLGNMKMLDDQTLGDIEADEPFSEIEAKRIRMVNRYLARMEQQIKRHWNKPVTGVHVESGVIKFSLNADGYVDDAYIYISSGNAALDISALEAIRRVRRYAVPESRAIAERYYRNLVFQYSSHELENEKMPELP